MSTPIPPICYACARLVRADPGPMRCDAYPQGIPVAILESEVDHTRPLPGDGGLQFVWAAGATSTHPFLTGEPLDEPGPADPMPPLDEPDAVADADLFAEWTDAELATLHRLVNGERVE